MSFSVRWLLLALPVAMVAFVTLSLVTGGTVRPYRIARVWGGPTEVRRLSLRVEASEVLIERAAVQETKISRGRVVVELHAPGFDARRSAELDPEGSAELSFELPAVMAPLELTVFQGDVLAQGPIALGAARWANAAKRRGGWVSGRAGAFDVRIAPESGALAVPFWGGVLVEVRRAGELAARVPVRGSGDGADVMPMDAQLTDARGRVRVAVQPRVHVALVSFELGEPGAVERVSFSIPVVPGAMLAEKRLGQLVIHSPVPRDVAYYALVTEGQRLLGGRVVLSRPDGSGGNEVHLPFPELDPAPTHVVVSSERDLRSPAAIGWPLSPRESGEPSFTFDAVDALLLDGGPRAALHEAHRARRVRWVVAGFSAAALALELLLLILFTKRSDRSLDAHLEGAGVTADEAELLAPRRTPRVVIALLVVVLGFFVVAAMGVLMAR